MLVLSHCSTIHNDRRMRQFQLVQNLSSGDMHAQVAYWKLSDLFQRIHS